MDLEYSKPSKQLGMDVFGMSATTGGSFGAGGAECAPGEEHFTG